MKRLMAVLVMAAASAGSVGCGSECDGVAEVCDQCLSGDAKVMCEQIAEFLVTNNDEEACAEWIEAGTCES